MSDTIAKLPERDRAPKLEAGAHLYRRLIAVAAALFSVALLPYPIRASIIDIGSPITAEGYRFTNFDYSPLTGTAVGSNVNGISNNGQVVGTTVDVNGMPTSTNFSGTPPTLNQLNTGAGQTAFGINSAGDVVGGNGTNAFFLPNGGSLLDLTAPMGAINAFGINDNGNIVGQFSSGANTPGFVLGSITSNTFTTINQPVGVTADVINAQGINNNGLVVGFYLGNDGQVHGFTANAAGLPGTINGTAVADPLIPAVAGEPGATFVFSQILGINDNGLAVGYYGDSTTSQHGYLYNTNTGMYTFVDDPAAQFHNGVEVTQITGISDTGEIAGFYTDAGGVAHSFIANPVPEPSSLVPACFGLGAIGLTCIRRRRKTRAA
ncbi:MAG TPA: PEP-CTERM sorting domain-containing protein [Bryobacteraceae bacterium]|jgi:hypothetical protein|nr:PEP-CTERM sorting domain-containing protein [Bryobacteraceae bacterium]